jgi:hypothetical protein
MRDQSKDGLQMIGRVGSKLKADPHVPGAIGDDKHVEMAVPDDEVSQPAAVDVAPLGG